MNSTPGAEALLLELPLRLSARSRLAKALPVRKGKGSTSPCVPSFSQDTG